MWRGRGGGYPRDFQGHPDRQQSKPIHNNVHTEPQIQGASLPNCRTRGRRPEPGCRNGKTCFSLFVGQGRGWVVGGISNTLYTLNKQQAGRVPGRGAWPPSMGGGRAAAGGTPTGGGMDLTWDLRPSGPGTRNCIIIYLMQADLGPFAGCKQTWDLGSPTQPQ